MTRGHYVVAITVSAVAALLLLLLAAWMTGGAYSPVRVHWFSLVFVFPLVIAAKVGFDRMGSFALAFFTYFAMIFACVRLYISTAALGVRGDKGKEGDA